MRCRNAFTLVELLVVISVIGLLAGLSIPAINQARAKADLAGGLSNLRQVGLALQSYASENDGILPCLFSGQSPRYTQNSTNSLGLYLWQYLGAPTPTSSWNEAKLLGSAPYFRKRKANDTVSLYLNYQVPVNNNTNFLVSPWGNPSTTTPALPWRMNQLAEAGMSKTWAMVDVDKTLAASPPSPTKPFTGNSWVANLPDKPLFGNVRTFLYFDGSAKSVAVGANP